MGRATNKSVSMAASSLRRDNSSKRPMIRKMNTLPFGIRDPEETIPHVTEAVRYLAEELEQGHKIAVFCDYDPDGTCAGECLRLVLLSRSITYDGNATAQVFYGYATAKKGFGLDSDFVEAAHTFGAKTLITLDCGSASVEAVSLAQKLGMKVIVTDHHQIASDNSADFHLNPALHGESQASGSIVAWKFALALAEEISGHPSQILLQRGAYLALFGARSDWMSMNDPENSALAAYVEHTNSVPPGLEYLAKQMFYSSAEAAFSEMDDVLNLPKRTIRAKAIWAAEVLKAASYEEAEKPVLELLGINSLSEEILLKMNAAAKKTAMVQDKLVYAQLRVEEGEDFTGHAGNVAHDLNMQHQKPAIVFIYAGNEKGHDIWRWAARHSNKNLSFTDNLLQIREASTLPGPDGPYPSAGGHPQAVSGKCSADRVQAVVQAFSEWAETAKWKNKP